MTDDEAIELAHPFLGDQKMKFDKLNQAWRRLKKIDQLSLARRVLEQMRKKLDCVTDGVRHNLIFPLLYVRVPASEHLKFLLAMSFLTNTRCSTRGFRILGQHVEALNRESEEALVDETPHQFMQLLRKYHS